MVSNDSTAFRFRVSLRLDGCECWREVLVPASMTFFDFHVVLQECFMWYGAHLFCFCATLPGGRQVQMGEPDPWGEDPVYREGRYERFMPVEPFPELLVSRETELGDVFPKTRTARYYYDYGDDWIHDVKLVRTYRGTRINDPQLWNGAGDAPPEDVGGIPGYERFMTVIADPDTDEFADMAAWAREQRWDRFALDKQRERLFHWRRHRDMML